MIRKGMDTERHQVSDPSNAQRAVLDAARQLLGNRHRHRTEGNVQSDVESVLRALRVGTIESHYQMGNEQADIYLPNRRTFVEVKAFPKAADPEKPQSRTSAESPRGQLDRYVLAEIQNELNLSPTLPGFSTVVDGPWTGIVTDGSNWHVYEYAHEADALGRLVTAKRFVNETEALAKFLIDTLGTEMLGKEWIPEKPGDLFSGLKSELDELYRQLPKHDANIRHGAKRQGGTTPLVPRPLIPHCDRTVGVTLPRWASEG